MATFRNLSTASAVELTDEYGVKHIFEAGEERTGLSNYFYHYTIEHLDSPILYLVGDLDGNGAIPAPSIRNENAMYQPGPNVPHSYTATPADSATPTVTPVDISGATGARRKNVTIDMNGELADARRQIESTFLGIPEVPTLRHSTTGLAISGLNASKTATVETGYFPVKVNGVKATAADAAANPAVEEGENYTAFGVLAITDADPADTGTFYYSIKGIDDELFIAADDNGDDLPDPAAASIVLATGVITFTAFTGGAAGDSAVASIESALNPDTAAKLAVVLGELDAYSNGYFRNTASGRLFLVDGTTVNAFNADASATVS